MAVTSTTPETLTATTAAKVAHDEHARSGRLRLTVNAGMRHTGRRRTPTLPKVSMDHGKPTPEREVQAPEGIDRATGSGAHRVRCPLETHWQHLGPELTEAAHWYLRLRSAVDTAQRTTPSYSGMPLHPSAINSHRGGVDDTERANGAELAFIEAKLEPEFAKVLKILDDRRGRAPQTLAGVARDALAYRTDDTAGPAGVAMLWAALVRLRSLQSEIRSDAPTALTRDKIAAGRLERQATTAREQFRREQTRETQ